MSVDSCNVGEELTVLFGSQGLTLSPSDDELSATSAEMLMLEVDEPIFPPTLSETSSIVVEGAGLLVTGFTP